MFVLVVVSYSSDLCLFGSFSDAVSPVRVMHWCRGSNDDGWCFLSLDSCWSRSNHLLGTLLPWLVLLPSKDLDVDFLYWYHWTGIWHFCLKLLKRRVPHRGPSTAMQAWVDPYVLASSPKHPSQTGHMGCVLAANQGDIWLATNNILLNKKMHLWIILYKCHTQMQWSSQTTGCL